jgi:hypothetical protein
MLRVPGQQVPSLTYLSQFTSLTLSLFWLLLLLLLLLYR